MSEQLKLQAERGKQFTHALRTATNFSSRIRQEVLIDEQNWPKFVTFPKEISSLVPNTYVSPGDFLKELGFSSEEQVRAAKEGILGESLAHHDDKVYPLTKNPAFSLLDKDFSLKVLNGSFNPHALTMSEAASHGFGFEDPGHRGVYQNAMQKLAETLVKTEYDIKGAGLRIFDDCGASADSIVGYLISQLQNPAGEEMLKRGVRVDLIAATAQSILILKRFAEVMGFPLEIHASHMAFGLTEHNYIVYPDELLQSESISKDVVSRLEDYRYQEDGNIYVVGEMGNAQMGLSGKDVEVARKKYQLDESFYAINEERTDPHGEHPKRQRRAVIENPEESDIYFVYFARGGYLPYAIDRKFNPDFDRAKSTIIRASRKNFEGDYGVAFRQE